MAALAASDNVDLQIHRLEEAFTKVEAAQGSYVKLPAAEMNLLTILGQLRDIMNEVVGSGDRDALQAKFGGDCSKIARVRAVLDAVKMSPMNEGDQRLKGCLDACASTEQVLVDLGSWEAMQAAAKAARDALLEGFKVDEEAARKRREEAEKKQLEEEEAKRKEDEKRRLEEEERNRMEEQKRREEEERKRQEDEKKRQEEEERARRQEEEKKRLEEEEERKRQEEEKKRLEEEERVRREEEERKRREEEEERKRREEEEERRRLEEEERRRLEDEERKRLEDEAAAERDDDVNPGDEVAPPLGAVVHEEWAELMGVIMCKLGCGRRAAPGVTRSGHNFDTCCRSCALGKGHHKTCGQIDPSKLGAGLCKMGCGRKVNAGKDTMGIQRDTCCRGCAVGEKHDDKCQAGKDSSRRESFITVLDERAFFSEVKSSLSAVGFNQFMEQCRLLNRRTQSVEQTLENVQQLFNTAHVEHLFNHFQRLLEEAMSRQGARKRASTEAGPAGERRYSEAAGKGARERTSSEPDGKGKGKPKGGGGGYGR